MASSPMLKTILSKFGKNSGLIIFVGLTFTILMLALDIWEPTFFRLIDNKLYDTLLKSNHNSETSGSVCIVDLDEKSLEEFGQWPWPRYRLASLIEKIKLLGASSIGLDMVLAEADRTSFKLLRHEFLRDLKIEVEIKGVPDTHMDNDKVLADVLSNGPFILGYKFLFDNTKNSQKISLLHPVNTAIKRPSDVPGDTTFLFNARGVIPNIKDLSNAVRLSGFLNAVADIDGIIRRAPLLIESNGRFYPSLPMAVLLQALENHKILLSIGKYGIESIHLGNIIIPTDTKGSLLIHYRGKGKTLKYFSASDILNDLVPGDRLKDKIVFLGTSAPDLSENHAIPLDALYPGIEVHATIADNILKGDFLWVPNWIKAVEAILVLAAGFLSTLILARTGALQSSLILGFFVIGILYCSELVFTVKGIFISPLILLITIGGNFTLLTLLKFRHEERKTLEKTRELSLTQHATIQSLTSLAETRDNDTGGHIRRTQRYIRILANHLKNHPKYRFFLDDDTIDLLYMSAPLHDAGKVGIPDNILLKPGKLTDEEFEKMKNHTTLGRDAIEMAEKQLGKKSFLRFAREIAYSHQEKWDGTGYPERISGESIPIPGRLMALADVYDALISKRIYKEPFSHEMAVKIIADGNGTHFDPDIVDAFLAIKEEFKQIALELADSEEQRQSLLQ